MTVETYLCDRPGFERVSIRFTHGENVFAAIGGAFRALERAGRRDAAEELQRRVEDAGDYDEALAIVGQYADWGA